MQIVIDIPDTLYESIQACKNIEDTDEVTVDKVLIKAVENGTPLPKGHGRLIDADEVDSILGSGEIESYVRKKYVLRAHINMIRGNLANIKPVIEADKAESEDEYA